MPGGNIGEENLEQRIERIRKRDEEIEKRHREAEADRLAALQANAMVKTTAPADDYWPKAHKYDKLDFTYDVKNENDTEEKKPTVDETRPQLRPFKKFPEGQGPPADPTYNFLADAERDGKAQANAVPSENKNWRVSNNSSSGNTAPNTNNRRNQPNNSSFNRGKNNNAKGKHLMQKGKSNDEPILRKNDRERERNNEQRLQRQISSDGMWRRNDDKKIDTKETKSNVSISPTGRNERQPNFKTDDKTGPLNSNSRTSNKSIQQRINTNNDAGNLQQKLSDLSIEKRGNITVSVTKDGEVKSVKLETARAIGTGRVGSGASMRPNIQPQQQQQQPYVSSPPALMDLNITAPALINYPVIDQFKPEPQLQMQPQVLPQSPVQEIPKPMASVNGVPFKLPSVQDRLIKNRVFFDEKMKNVAQVDNNAVAGKQ